MSMLNLVLFLHFNKCSMPAFMSISILMNISEAFITISIIHFILPSEEKLVGTNLNFILPNSSN